MKRFITVASKHGEEVLVQLRNGVIAAAGADAYQLLKRKLQEKGILHHDQNAGHHSQLPHKGGYTSFYVEQGQWMKVNH